MDTLSSELIDMIFNCSTINNQLTLSQTSSWLRSYKTTKLVHYLKFRKCLNELTKTNYIIINNDNSQPYSVRITSDSATLYRYIKETGNSSSLPLLPNRLWTYHSKSYANHSNPHIRRQVVRSDYYGSDSKDCFKHILNYLKGELNSPLMSVVNTTVLSEQRN